MTGHRWPRQPSGDEGSVLIMALAFLSLFGLASAAVLGFAETGFRTAGSVDSTAKQQYAVDAAVEAAVNTIRADPSIGRAPYDNPACAPFPAQVNGTAVAVRCTSRPGSGVTSITGGGGVPADAALTLPSSTAEGVTVEAGAAPRASGNVTTRQRVTVPAGSSLSVVGTLSCASTTVAGTVTASTNACPGTPSAGDPAYPLPITEAPVQVAPPGCPAGAVATFAPGTYRDALALNALMGGACTGKQFHFTPGTYYFDFTGATTQWLVNDATAEVVGGALTTTAFPSRCDLAQAGVEFIFAGESRIAVTAGSLEICPPLAGSASAPRVAVRGSPTSTPDQAPQSPTLGGGTATNVPGVPRSVPFTDPGAAAAVDGVSASVTLGCNKCTGSLALGGYPSAGVPVNAVITSATMEVNHSKGLPPGDITIRVNAGDGTFASYLVPPCVMPCAPGTTLSTVDVLALLSTPAKANALSAVYTAVDAPGQGALTVSVDGVAFRITYQVLGIKASSGCATAAGPYAPGSSTSCAVLRGTGGATARMAIKGTVYAPLAPVDLSLTAQATAVTQRGIVSRTLWLGLTSAAGYSGPTVTLPGSGPRFVLLTASIGGTARLRAEVTIDDGLGLSPGATVAVTRWSVLR